MIPAGHTSPRLAHAAIGFGAFAAIVAFVAPLSATWSAAPDLGHAWVVPLLMAYLWWERWHERPALLARPGVGASLWIVVLCAAALHLFIRLFLTPFPLWPAALLAYTLLLAALVLLSAWLLSGRAGIRWIAGPLVLAAGALPVPSAIENALIIPLRQTWATLAAEISNLLGQPALAFGTSVRIGNAWVGVDEACGGIRSLQACILAGLFFGEWLRFSISRRAALLVAAIAAALVGNFLRVLFLTFRASEGPDALAAAHDPAGWLAMSFSLIATAWLACHWNGYKLPRQAPPAARSSTGSLFRPATIWIATVATILMVNETATRVWYLYGQREIASLPQWTASFPEEHWSFQPAPLSDFAREILNPDIYRAGSWRESDDIRASGYYIEWNRGQVARSIPFLHNPTICLPAAGCELVGMLDPIEITTPAGTIPFHVYKFRQSGEELLVAFTIWDPSRAQPLAQPNVGSWRSWWHAQWNEVREARQHQPAQLLTVAVPSAPTQATSLERIIPDILRSFSEPM